MRERLELNARRTRRRIGVVRNEVAPAELQRIHPDPGGGELDQAFGHRGRDRMADRTVLAHHVLVLEHDPRARPVVRAGVRPAHEIHDLVCFDAAGARVDRIGPDAGEVVDFPRRDGAVALYADAGVHPMVARMNVGDEAFQPVSNEFDRPPQ